MSLVVKLWLGFIIVLSGFTLTVALTDVRTRTDEHFLITIDGVLVPAAHAAQESLAHYRSLQQSFQDGVVFGDESALLRSRELTERLTHELETIHEQTKLPENLRAEALAINRDLVAHVAASKPIYLRLTHAEEGESLIAAAAECARRSDEILGRLTRFQLGLRKELTASLAGRIKSGTHERLTSEIVLVAILLPGGVGLAVLIRNLSRRLALLVAASGKLASGDYDTSIAVGGRDEIGRLAALFEIMRAAISGRNRELKDLNRDLDELVRNRTAQLEDRNHQLSLEVAERARAEHAFRLVQAALVQMEDGVVIAEAGHALDHPPEYVNPGFFGVLGLPWAGGFDQPLRTLFNPLQVPETLAQAFNEASEGHARISEILFSQPGQGDRVIEWMVSPIRSESGSTTHVIAIIRNLTEQRLAEAQRQQGIKLESIGQLAAGVAHEINTPIQFIGDNLNFLSDSFGDIQNVLAAYADILTSGRASGAMDATLLANTDATLKKSDLEYLVEEIPKAVAQSQEGVVRVSEIVRAMKEFSHPDAGERKAVDLNQTIRTTLTVARNEYKYVADLVTDFASDLPAVPCFVGEFNQVVLNLIVNAAHAIGDVVAKNGGKGLITVSTKRHGQSVEIRIKDTGTGIPESALGRIFDPFFTTKSVGKGTGQGLYIAHSVIVKKHQGSIEVETEMGVGTAFVIRIPLATDS